MLNNGEQYRKEAIYRMDAKNKGKKRAAIIYIIEKLGSDLKRKNDNAIVILEELTIS